MKKGILFAASLLSILGFVAVAQAAAPTVSAGSAQTITLPTSSVTLTGTSVFNAPATAIASSAWTFTSGPATPVIATPSALSTSVTGLTVAGNYVFTLTSTDNAVPAFSATSPVTITVAPAASLAPVVNAGADQIITGATATLTGTATASSGRTIATYAWSQISGPSTSAIATAGAASTAVSGLAVGTYTYSLAVTDSAGSTTSDTVSISVGMNNPPLPVVIAQKKMKLNINENGKVELIGSLEAISGTTLTVKVYGISFTVNAANTKFDGTVKDFSLYKVGDMVSVQGAVDPAATTLTINARNVKDMSIKNTRERRNRENERKHEDDMDKQDGNLFPSLDSHNQKPPKFEDQKGNSNNGNKGNGRGEREDH